MCQECNLDNNACVCEFNIYRFINTETSNCLNEAKKGSGIKIFKPYSDRLTGTDNFVESDVDQDLLFNLNFTGDVKIHAIIISGFDDGSHPKDVKIFKNIENMSIGDVESKADQILNISKDPKAEVKIPLVASRFSSCKSLSIYIADNFGDETTKIHFIALFGEFTEAKRQEICVTNYELRPSLADHKNDLINNVFSNVIQ